MNYPIIQSYDLFLLEIYFFINFFLSNLDKSYTDMLICERDNLLGLGKGVAFL